MRIRWYIGVLPMLVIPFVAVAQMASTNYSVRGDATAGGGGFGSSDNYQANDTITENATPSISDMSSANYHVCAGFQCDVFAKKITAVITTSNSSCTASTPQVDPLEQSLGTLSRFFVKTAPQRICVIVSSSGAGSVTVTARSENGGMKSVSNPTSVIDSTSGALAPGTAGYGICGSAATQFTKVAPFDGSCTTSGGDVVGELTTSPASVFTASGEVTDAVGEILTKAVIAANTPSASDYTDSINIIVSGSF